MYIRKIVTIGSSIMDKIHCKYVFTVSQIYVYIHVDKWIPIKINKKKQLKTGYIALTE